MIKFIKEYFGVYYLLYLFSFLSIYFANNLTPIFSVVILISSYYLIIRKQRFDAVIALILYSRCLNGFIILHDETAFIIINILTNVFPLVLYFTIVLSHEGLHVRKAFFVEYKFTILLFALLTGSFILNYATSYDIITKRYLPFALFIFFIVAFRRVSDFDAGKMLKFFRSIFVASIIVYLFSDYLPITRNLMESDTVFSVASDPNSFNLVYFSFTRNLGPTFDHRILAIMAYLFLLLCLIYKSENLKLDIMLSTVIVVSSLSRGAIVTYTLILIAYIMLIGRRKLLIVMLSVGFVTCVVFVFSKGLLTDSILGYIQSFSPGATDNALDQRSVFANYAMNSFAKSPVFGQGVGYLTSQLIDRAIMVDGNIVTVVGDAFWFVLLGETGIIGVLLYVLFLTEVFLTKNLLFVALFLGFSLQLLGTDIPDMRFYYFAILALIYIAKNASQEHREWQHQ